MAPRRRPRTLRTPEPARPDVAATVVVSGLRRTFVGEPPVTALDGVDLDVPAGRLTAILGPSGSGKTTLLRVLAGTERADAGTVRVRGVLYDGDGPEGDGAAGDGAGTGTGGAVAGSLGGADARRRTGRVRRVHVVPERRRVGLVPQEGALFPHLDVAGNVAFGLHRLPRSDRPSRVAAMLDLVGLDGLAARRPGELSGGQQQRVALARALAPAPDVVLLDEPFSALDASLRVELRTEVAALLRSTGTTAVLVTHDQDEAMSIADHLAVMRAGRIVQQGSPEDLYRRPADLWVATFLGDAVVLDGVLSASPDSDGLRRARCALGTVAVDLPDTLPPVPGPVRLLFRPEQIWRAAPGRPSDQPPDRGSEKPTTAIVQDAQAVGPELRVRLSVGDDDVVARWPSSARSVDVGDVVALELLGRAMAFRSEG